MCGIAGFYGFENKKELATLANKIQQHRGPDYQGIWGDNVVEFAHQRLSIIDLSESANQPFVKDGLIIVFNGEIYNYKYIKDMLASEHGCSFQTSSDTEVVLESYRVFGTKCLDQFIGMFAFAIYDTQSKKTFIARDHFGIKPLFFTKIDGNFAFASELKTLTAIDGFDKTINPYALVQSINYLWIPDGITMFKNSFKLPAAHYMILDKNLDYELFEYWKLEDKLLTTKNEKEVTDHLSKLFENTIERHMVADVPVSAFLSGGLDSSMICVASKKYSNSLSTYTIGTTLEDKKVEQMPDDEKYAKFIADKNGFNHHEITVQPDIVKILPQIVKTLDEPIGDAAAINTYLICKAAKDNGAKVLLSGMGADEVFFGYRRQKATLMAQKYKAIPKFIRRFNDIVIGKLPVKLFGHGIKYSRWAKRFISFANSEEGEAYRMSYSYYSPPNLKSLFLNKHDGEIDKMISEHDHIFNEAYKDDIHNKMCNTDIKMFMNGLNLTYSDRASMMASVEVRVPYIDKEIIEYAMQIPGRMKYQKGESKFILKKVAERYLPNKIIYRPKASFGVPLRSWISGELKPMVDEFLSEDNIKKRGIFDYKIVSDIIKKDRLGLEDNAQKIYQLITLELWFRSFVD
jgi:asparagine synthase (glutamine-hydrolysing)